MREVVERPEVPKSLRFLYCTRFGGLVLRMCTRRWLSKLAGKYLDSKASRRRIKKYVRKNGIRMEDYLEEDYNSFNAFFTRRIKPELRPFDMNPDSFVSPCDAKLSAYTVDDESKFDIKGFTYTVQSLLGDDEIAGKFRGGLCLVFRLAVTDYHRYFFFDGGVAEGNTFIKGRLHTVQPVALERRRVFTENCREYTLLHTDNFGDAVMVEVGAMMVGRIVNDIKSGRFERGDEKGRFEFGGSTVVLLLEKDSVQLDEELFRNTADGKETVVKCGEKLGSRKDKKTTDA